MDAIEFLEEKDRMCRFYGTCSKCPCFHKSGIAVNCILANGLSLAENKEQVAIVEKWSAAHPRKTRQSVFLEQYPNVRLVDGVVDIAPCQMEPKKLFHRCCWWCMQICTLRYLS